MIAAESAEAGPTETAVAEAPTHEATIEADGLRQVYRARDGLVEAIERIDLRVAGGELVAVLGPSGCGKSTLLRIVCGLLEPTEGIVWLAGQPPREARSSLGVGWLAQDDGLLPWRTVASNVRLALEVGRRGPADERQVNAILAEVGLRDSTRRYPHQLSGGMRQRTALARALVAGPAFFFLDEPFANLDEQTRERLGDLLLEIRAARQPTTLLVTHSVVEAARLADRVLVLSPRPARLLADLVIPLPRPRRYDQPGFGELVQRLNTLLADPAAALEPPGCASR